MTTLAATLYLERAHLALADDSTVSIIAGTSTRTDTTANEGSFRSYANGVTRLITGTGRNRVEGFTLRALTPAEVATVKSMIGKVCVFRDTYGRRIFGSFLTVQETDIPHSGRPGTNSLLTDVVVTSFVEVTYEEGV